MNTLCVYYSRSGISKEIAETIAKGLDAELVEITDGKAYGGFFGYIKAAIVGLRKNLPELKEYKTKLEIEEYDRVINVGPVWCERFCPINRQFTAQNEGKIKKLICVVTHMSKLPYTDGLDADEVLTVQTSKHDWTEEVNEFINRIK